MAGELGSDGLERGFSRDLSESDESSLRRELESEVECPVCYNIPRTLPVPCCPAGHITCARCRSRVVHCPTCRRLLGDNTSHLAAAIIDKVQHKCRFWEQGCGYKALLKDLEGHEVVCNERTIQCPLPNGCDEKVQLKNFYIHAMRNQCAADMKPVMKFNLSRGYLTWTGQGRLNQEEFNLSEDLAWSFFHTRQHGQHFFFSAQYFALDQLFMFYVGVLGGGDLAKEFMTTIELVKGDISMKYRGPILPMDKIPPGECQLMLEESCFVVHYRAMRNLLAVTEVGENMNKSWSVDFDAKVEIFEQERPCPVDRLTQYFLEEPPTTNRESDMGLDME